MNGIWRFGAIAACSATLAVSAPSLAKPEAPSPLAHQLDVRPLARGAWVFVAQPWDATSLVVEAEDGTVVWVDTPPTPAQTETLLAWIRAELGDRRVIAVNSHHHIDAAGGNQVLAAAGIPIYGTDLTVREQGERAVGMLADLAETFRDDPFMTEQVARLVPTAPTRPFPSEGVLSLTLGRERVELLHPGPAHSADNLVVWFPERRILYGGCMVKDGESLGYLGEADLVGWGPALERLRALRPRIVVPGHGRRTDPGLLSNTARLLEVQAAAR